MSWLQTETMETIGVQLQLSGELLTVIAAYFTGTVLNHNYAAYRRDLRRLMSHRNVLVLGDLNSKHEYWGCRRRNYAGTVLYQELVEGSFEVLAPDSPTYHPSNLRIPAVLDIVLKKSPLNIDPPSVADDLGSDHLPIILCVPCAQTVNFCYNEVPCLAKANWAAFLWYMCVR